MKNNPTVWETCILKTNALDIKVSDQIASLEEAIASLDQGERFFAKTHITRGLKDLMNEGIARLGGSSSQAVFHLKQAMGGGKTHLLTCMGLLARHPELRQKICPDLHERFPFARAAVAAFNGRNFNSLFWEEIAQQLDRADIFKNATMHTPPDEAGWLKLFADNRPYLILLDELPPYLSHHNSIACGKGSQADLLCQSFSSLLTAAAKKKNVCIILSDLHAAYKESGKMIEEALRHAQQEVGRQEKTIIPVDLTGQEIYAILRKTLFETLPDEDTIRGIATEYADKLQEAGKSKTIDRSAVAIADEIASTYPFHPKLKNLIALFKENETFRQARGLIELISRLLRSVWERKDENAFLIGAEQFDFSIVDVRNAFETINSMPDVVANDIWDEKGGAVAQKFAPESKQCSTQKVASLLFTSSLSTSVNAIKGLSETDLLECLIAPNSNQDEFKAALQHLKENAWYLHSTTDGKLYFDKQENLAKKLQRWADDAPQPKVDSLKRDQLRILFKANKKSIYQEILALPTIDEVLETIKKGRALIIYDPDGKTPPERLQELFETVTQKNNFCVLTGSKTALSELDQVARALYAIKTGEALLNKEKETEEFKERKKSAEHNFLSTLLALFNQILIPSWDKTKNIACLRAETIRWKRQNQNGFEGEEEIIQSLTDTGIAKFIPEIDYEKIRPRVERDLFESEDRIRWNDLLEKSVSNTRFPWLCKGALDFIKKTAFQRGAWEDEGNGWINKKPAAKKATVRIIPVSETLEDGTIELEATALHAGPSPKIYYSETPQVTEKTGQLLSGQRVKTKKLRLYFLAVDPTRTMESDAPFEWKREIKIIDHTPKIQGNHRFVELKAIPYGIMKYTLNGSDPKIFGTRVEGAIDIGKTAQPLRVCAEADGVEGYFQHSYQADSIDGPSIDPNRPALLNLNHVNGVFSDATAWQILEKAQEINAKLFVEKINLKDGQKILAIRCQGSWEADPAHWKQMIQMQLPYLGDQAVLDLTVNKIQFQTGRDLEAFAKTLDLSFETNKVEQ